MTAFSIRNFSTILITQPYHILDSLILEQYLAKVPELVEDRAKIFEKGGEGTINISMKNVKTKVVQHVPLSIRL